MAHPGVVRQGQSDVFHQQPQVQRVGWAGFNSGNQVQVELSRPFVLGMHQETATAELRRPQRVRCVPV